MSIPNLDLMAAVDSNWGIGRHGDLLFHLHDDMKRFREITAGGVVIMGRKTLESLPGGRPLPGRTNIVLSRTIKNPGSDYSVFRDRESVLAELSRLSERSAFVIGGQEIYELFLPWCSGAYITFVQCERQPDRKMPDLDATKGWICVKESVPHEEDGLVFTYRRYRNAAQIVPSRGTHVRP